jgi:hypothetical protein
VSAELMQMLMGFRTSQAIQVAATLRVPDLFADGPRSSAELAGPAGADGPALHRLLRALAAIGVFHEDDEAAAILARCGEAMAPDARVLVIDRILGPPNEGAEGKFSDLNMLVMPGGRERTEAEFAALFERVGLRLVRTVPTAAGPAILEAAA